MKLKINIQSILHKLLVGIGISLIIFLSTNHLFPFQYALYSGLITAALIIILFLINDYYLFPNFFFRKNRTKYILYSALFILGITAIHLIIERIFIVPHRIYQPPDKLPFIFPVMRSFFIFLMVHFISITIQMAGTIKEQATREKNLKEEKLGTELKLLKAQINPHFIFNALNNIYSLTYSQSEKAPESVLKLSEMLRYVFYDCSKDTVKLKDEIAYIENFIAFQQMKSEHKQDIQLDYSNAGLELQISPMLFIPFIENAFKYSKIEEYTEAYIKIKLMTSNGKISFFIENSIPEEGKPMPGKGLGIQNVRQRLKVLYPGLHDLNIKETHNKFTVNLEIQVK